MKQLLLSRSNNNYSTGTVYNQLSGGGWTATEAAVTTPWCVAGSFKNLRVTVMAAPGSGKSVTFTVLVNGVASSLTCTISDTDTTAEDVTHSVSIADGDTVVLRAVGTDSPTVASSVTAIEFESTTTSESGYSTVPVDSSGTNNNRWAALWNSGSGWGFGSNELSLNAVQGNITKLLINILVPPGSGKSITYSIRKNGVVQNGSGGTVDTQVTFNDLEVSKSATFTLPVSPGDLLALQQSSTANTPANPSRIGWAIKLVPDIEGDFNFGTNGSGFLNTSTTAVFNTVSAQFGYFTWDATEANRSVFVNATAGYRLTGLYTDTGNIISGNGVQLDVYVNGSPSNLTLIHTAIVHGVAADVSVPASATLSIRAVGLGGGGSSRTFKWGIRATLANTTSLIGRTKAANGTTPVIDTTGATALVIVQGWTSDGSPPTDNKSNEWIRAGFANNPTNANCEIWIALNPIVGVNHTFSTGTLSGFETICVGAFRGPVAFEIESVLNGSGGSSVEAIAAGSHIATRAKALIIAALAYRTESVIPEVDDGFTVVHTMPYVNTVQIGTGLAYRELLEKTTVDPEWSWTGASGANAVNLALLVP